MDRARHTASRSHYATPQSRRRARVVREKNRQGMKRRVWRVSVGLLVILLGLLVWKSWPQERLLMQRAARVGGIDSLTGEDFCGGLPPFTWFSDHEIGY